MNDVLNGAGTEIVRAGLHSEAINADGFRFFGQNHVGDVLLPDIVGVDDGGNHGLGDAFVIGAKLLGVFRKAVTTVTEGRVIIMAANARVEADSFDNILSVEMLELGVGVEFVKVSDTKGKVGVCEEFDGLGFGGMHKFDWDVLFDGAF